MRYCRNFYEYIVMNIIMDIILNITIVVLLLIIVEREDGFADGW